MNSLAPLFLILSILAPARPADDGLELSSPGFGGTFPERSPQAVLVPSSDGLHLVYASMADRRSEVFWRRLSGDSWGEAVQLSDVRQGIGSALPLALLDSAGRLQVGWISRDRAGSFSVHHRSRKTNGDWGPVQTFQTGADAPAPTMVEDGQGRLYVSFRTTVPEWKWGRIYLYVSEDGGESWRLSDPNYADDRKLGYCNSPHMVANGSVVTLVWTDQTPGGEAVVTNRTIDGGRTWLKEPVVLSRRELAYRRPVLIESGLGLHVVWLLSQREPTGSYQELWAVHQDGVGGWSEPTRIHRSRATHLTFQVGVAGGELFFAGIETRAVDPKRVVFKSFWEDNHYLESEAVEIWPGGRRSLLDGLSLVTSGDMVGVMFSERGSGQSGVHLEFRANPEQGWQHIKLSKEAEKLNKERGDVDAMAPVGFLDPDRRGLRFLFHLVQRRRFLEEKADPSTQLVFGRLILAP